MKLQLLFSTMIIITFLFSCNRSEDLEDISSSTNVNKTEKGSSASNPLFFSNGMFLRDISNRKVYVIFEGKRRYIQSPLTLYGLFKNPYVENRSIFMDDLGKDLTPDNGLIQHTATGKIYLREGNVLRYIPNMEIFNLYHFNTNAITRLSDISNYTIGYYVGLDNGL